MDIKNDQQVSYKFTQDTMGGGGGDLHFETEQ